jgi:hypothetical protein
MMDKYRMKGEITFGIFANDNMASIEKKATELLNKMNVKNFGIVAIRIQDTPSSEAYDEAIVSWVATGRLKAEGGLLP